VKEKGNGAKKRKRGDGNLFHNLSNITSFTFAFKSPNCPRYLLST
jgi:hypothetical protein